MTSLASTLPLGTSSAVAPVLPLWKSLRTLYLARRPMLIGPDGEAYPDTTVGDVRTIVARLSAALSHPRFDHAQLGDARRAWRAATARVHNIGRGRGWYHTYPDNVSLWWRDTRQLAEALAAVDARRDAIRAVDSLPTLTVAYTDARILWGDLRHWFLLRRAVRRDRASLLTYPVTTVAEVVRVADLLATAIADRARGDNLRARVAQVAAGLAPDDTYPDTAAFWCIDSRRAVGACPEVAP